MSANTYSVSVVLLLTALGQPALAADDESQNETPEPPSCKFCPDNEGWSGWIEGGLGFQSDDSYHFGRYSGYEEEGFLGNVNGEFDYRDENGNFIEAVIDDLLIETRLLKIQGGRQGQYEVGFEYDQITNFREQSAYSPYRDQNGDGILELPAGWVPGLTTYNMPNLGSALVKTPLKTERDRTGANFTFYPSNKWEVSGYIRHEEKEGVKDVGATFGFDQTVILPVPFKYETDDFGLTLNYNNDKFQSRISYISSLFKNDQNVIGWQNPYENISSNTAFGQMAEAPENQFHQFSALLGYQLTTDTRVSARFARGLMKQNEDFQAYSINPGITLSSLPATSLDGKVNTTLASLQVASQPLPKLRLDASYTFSDRDNQTSINTYDYVVTDLATAGLRKNAPYSFEQQRLHLKAGYRLPSNMNLSLGLDDDKMDRTHTSVEQTDDKTLWVKLKVRPMDLLETTLKYSISNRDASDFTPLSATDPLLNNPNGKYENNILMRAHNMADRSRDKLGFEIAYTPINELTIGLDLESIKDDYDNMIIGLQQAKGLIYTASISYAASETLVASMYYSYDKLSSDQSGSEKILPTDPENLWVAADSNVTSTLGVGMNWAAIEDELDVGAELTYSEFTGNIEYIGAVDLAELSSTLASISVHGVYTMSEEMSLRADYRYESYEESDWSKDGVVNTLPALLSLGTATQDYTASLVLVSLRYQF